MPKVMIFIDGTWLYSNQQHLTESFGRSFYIDYGKLPLVIADHLSETMGGYEVDVVRTFLFGSNAIHYQPVDEHLVERRRDFFDLLREEFHYEVDIYSIDYRGRRLRKKDRDALDDFEPTEKCVDIALASNMLYNSALPGAYDIAVLIAGDKDFIPALQHVRRLGKRVCIASIRKSCCNEFREIKDENRLRDFDVLWIDDILDKLELKIETRRLECRSPLHKGDKFVYTDAFIRKGRKFYCPSCIEEYNKVKFREVDQYVASEQYSENSYGGIAVGTRLHGVIKRLHKEKFYGFIRSNEGDYFFHLSDLVGLDFNELEIGLPVDFEVAIPASADNPEKPNGKATRIELAAEDGSL